MSTVSDSDPIFITIPSPLHEIFPPIVDSGEHLMVRLLERSKNLGPARIFKAGGSIGINNIFLVDELTVFFCENAAELIARINTDHLQRIEQNFELHEKFIEFLKSKDLSIDPELEKQTLISVGKAFQYFKSWHGEALTFNDLSNELAEFIYASEKIAHLQAKELSGDEAAARDNQVFILTCFAVSSMRLAVLDSLLVDATSGISKANERFTQEHSKIKHTSFISHYLLPHQSTSEDRDLEMLLLHQIRDEMIKHNELVALLHECDISIQVNEKLGNAKQKTGALEDIENRIACMKVRFNPLREAHTSNAKTDVNPYTSARIKLKHALDGLYESVDLARHEKAFTSFKVKVLNQYGKEVNGEELKRFLNSIDDDILISLIRNNEDIYSYVSQLAINNPDLDKRLCRHILEHELKMHNWLSFADTNIQGFIDDIDFFEINDLRLLTNVGDRIRMGWNKIKIDGVDLIDTKYLTLISCREAVEIFRLYMLLDNLEAQHQQLGELAIVGSVDFPIPEDFFVTIGSDFVL